MYRKLKSPNRRWWFIFLQSYRILMYLCLVAIIFAVTFLYWLGQGFNIMMEVLRVFIYTLISLSIFLDVHLPSLLLRMNTLTWGYHSGFMLYQFHYSYLGYLSTWRPYFILARLNCYQSSIICDLILFNILTAANVSAIDFNFLHDQVATTLNICIKGGKHLIYRLL